MWKVVEIVFIGYYAIEVLMMWLPWLAQRWLSAPALPPEVKEHETHPLIYMVVPCRDAAESIPALVECLLKQDYPASRYRILLLIDSDNESDSSRDVACALGVEVYLRCGGKIRTKGDAVNELLDRYLKHKSFDGMVILDVDSRVAPHFLRRVAAYLNQGAQVVQGAATSRNPHETPLTSIGYAAQSLIHIRQAGRVAMGLPAFPTGAGLTISYASLQRLDWHLATGRHLADDVELGLRCLLLGLSVRYAPDQQILVELPGNSGLISRQRRRWNASYLELVWPYTGPLVLKGFTKNPLVFYDLFDILLAPPLSLLFVFGGLMTLLLAILQCFSPAHTWAFGGVAGIWVCQGTYYMVVLRSEGHSIIWENKKAIVEFMTMRLTALIGSLALVCKFKSRNRWEPMPHKER